MANHTKEKVLITGITGFTGVYLEEYLLTKGYEVYGLSNSKSNSKKHLECDILDANQVKAVLQKVQPSYIFHLAGITSVDFPDKSLMYSINVIGTENLLEACLGVKKEVKKVIVASSATVYGNQDINILSEDLIPEPVNHYGISKLAMEKVANLYRIQLPIIITRPFNYVGKGQSSTFVVPKIIEHFKKKKSEIELGNIEVKREFNSIDFAIEVYYRLMLSNNEGIVNLCSGELIGLRDIVEKMEAISRHKIGVKINPKFIRVNEIKQLSGSTSRLKSWITEFPKNNLSLQLESWIKS